MPHNFSKDRSLVEDKPVEKKIGLLEEFEEWLKENEKKWHFLQGYDQTIHQALVKLEELKEKYKVG